MANIAPTTKPDGDRLYFAELGDAKLWLPTSQHQLMQIDDPDGRLRMADVTALLISPDDIDDGYNQAGEIIRTSQRLARRHFAFTAGMIALELVLAIAVWFVTDESVLRVFATLLATVFISYQIYGLRDFMKQLAPAGTLIQIGRYAQKHDSDVYVAVTDIQTFIRQQNSPWANARKQAT